MQWGQRDIPRRVLILLLVIWTACLLTLFTSRSSQALMLNDDSNTGNPPGQQKGTMEESLGFSRSSRKLSAEQISVLQDYSISPEVCNVFPTKIFLVVIVTTRVTGFDYRQAIRSTWASIASPVCGVRVLFMTGATTNEIFQARIETEAAIYGDIIQSNQFEDRYNTQPAKSLQLLRWSATFCTESTYTAKIDDDNWLNLPKYEQFLQTERHTDFALGGILRAGTWAIRDPGHKNYEPKENYAPEKFPEYLSGMLYAYPTKLIPKLLEASRGIPILNNEDVYINGLLAARANITRKQVPDYAWSPNPNDPCQKQGATCIHYVLVDDMYKTWDNPCYRYRQIC